MEELVLFLLCFLLVFIIYQIFVVSKAKKNNNSKKANKKEPIEVRYLVSRYRLDLKKISYPQLLQIVALVSSFDISLIVSVVMLFDSYWAKIVVAVIVIVPVILISYHLVYMFYRKKGMIKDE